MKRIAKWVLLIGLQSARVLADGTGDPVEHYLAVALNENGYLERFYSDDKVLRMDIDFNGDGILETLITLARDNSGRAGSNWLVYRKTGDHFESVGRAIFSSSRFYLGHIDEIGQYGVVNYWSSGAGEGGVAAYIYDGTTISRKEIGKIASDQHELRIANENMLAKYFGDRATLGTNYITEIPAQEFGARYGIRVESGSHRESVAQSQAEREAVIRIKEGAQYEPSSPPASAIATRSANRDVGESDYHGITSRKWLWGLGTIAVAVALTVLFIKRR